MLALLAATAALAPTATVGREGTELVYRGASGVKDRVTLVVVRDAIQVFDADDPNTRIAPGAGCKRGRDAVECPVAGITTVRVHAGDGNDLVAVQLEQPLIVDLGPGDDEFGGDAPSLALTGGDGDDEANFGAKTGAIDMGPGNDIADAMTADLTGPLTLAGGDGNDRLFIFGETGPGTAMSGGSGDDWFTVQAGEGPGADIGCGEGADRIVAELADRPGAGCGPYLAGITPGTVSRTFREGALTAPATGTVTLHRDKGEGDAAATLARGTFDAPAGPLRVRLKTTAAGRRGPKRPRVIVTVRTRSGGERHEVTFRSRLR
ncbi:hypothetical protein OJ997_19265 [Solirubrobacter phytolaccae]|uniref:Calcium-binding protein n=1 Tax=Solirubrobacter phytolaccae TaxID=1404360 RepID=A0A9X3NJF6_9ACTN|nr:hypothetical protein [Solirubrobacter phytolaccae]MDA0182457.1 hypothetical protein [Solirubrobacter phytolaccae]